jgi:hypothetical protein
MNYQIAQNEHIPFSLFERNPAFSKIPATVIVVSSDPASVSVVLDATPAPDTNASGYFLGGAKIQNGVMVTATVRQADGQTRSNTYTFDVVAEVPQTSSLAFQLGRPVLPADAPIAPRPAFRQANQPIGAYDDRYPNVAPHNVGLYPTDDRYPDTAQAGVQRRSMHQ